MPTGVGRVALAMGEATEARSYFEKTLKIAAGPVESTQSNFQFQRDIAVAHERIGDVSILENRSQDALYSYSREIFIVDAAFTASPDRHLFPFALSLPLAKAALLAYGLGRYTEALPYSERWVSEERKSGTPTPQLAVALGSLSFGRLFVKDFAEAKAAAVEAREIDGCPLEVLTNLAHAEMFLGNAEAGLALHRVHRADKVNENQTWADAVRDDFAMFRKAGLDHPLMPEIERILGEATAGNEKAEP